MNKEKKPDIVPRSLLEMLKVDRVRSGIMLQDAAKEIGRSSSWLSRVERGIIPVKREMYDRIASIYKTKEQNEISAMLDENNRLKEENQKLKEMLGFYIGNGVKE